MLKAFIFDVDGTLIDSVDAHADSWTRTLRQFGCDAPYDKVRSQIGKNSDLFLREFLTAEEIGRHGEAMKNERKHLFESEYLHDIAAFPKVPELMEKILAENMQIALATSATGEEIENYKKIADIADLIEHQTHSDDIEHSKPHPATFQAAFEQLHDVEPSEVLVIGDSPWDAKAATRGGFVAVGVLCGGFEEAELLQAGCKAVFEDPRDLLRNFDDLPELLEA